MLKCYACRCHSAQPIIRRVLRTAHAPNWGIHPIITGKAECLSALEAFPSIPTIEALKKYIRDNSSWAVILGYDDTNLDWAEVGHGGEKARLDGRIIVERYKEDETTKNN